MTSAKGLGGGYVAIAAVLAGQHVYEAVAQGSGDFSHGHTFNGYLMACAASIAVVRYLENHKLVERVRDEGPGFLEILRSALDSCPFIDEVRGHGFLFGVTCRDDNGEFLNPSLKVARRVDVAALDQGLLVYSTQPTSDGYMADQTMLTPAFTTTQDGFVEIARRLRRAIERVDSEVESDTPLASVVG